MALTYPISRRRLGLCLAASMAALALPLAAEPAAAATPDEIKARGKLIVGVLTDYPPFGGTDSEQKPAGYDADVAALMAKKLGVSLELVPVTGPNRIPYLLTNKVDLLIATFGITPERMKQVLFSNPYSTLTTYIMGPKDLKVTKPEELVGVTVGVARASTQDITVSQIAPSGTQIMRFDDDATTTQALISGQVQSIGASNTVLAQLTKDYASLGIEAKFKMKEQANGMAFRKADTALQEWCNGFIAEIVADGQLSQINQKWFGSALAPLPPMPKF
ncbi:transporter substrate-binding domain-containing protein [Labrys sp. La1]|uniref:transporter substrate-binding domain-containing protein n=1 Tax=Labrys sp. La1 TaxID=3404917 RepID=UPI003EC025CE